MSKGYIYAARQRGAREVKIGKTRKIPVVRLGQLNNTSVFKDLKFEVLQAGPTSTPRCKSGNCGFKI